MSGPDDIDALVVARRLLAAPSRVRVTDNEVLAMAGCLIGLDEVIDQLEAQPTASVDRAAERPTTNARLAAALASFIKQHEAALRAGTIADRSLDAFNSLKTIFEEEFPYVGN